jgi:hypothetical protein
MPRYYFHLRSCDSSYDDPEGTECQDDDAALEEARAAARELSADRLKRGLATADANFEVRDSGGAVIGTVRFPKTTA